MTPHLTRRTRLVSASVALCVLLTACGGSDDEPADEPEVLSQESADSALLTLDDVGEGFVDSTEPEEEESDLGCLSAIDDLDDLDADTEAKVSFDAESDAALRSILSGVSSFEDPTILTDAFDDFTETIEGCELVDVTDPSGFDLVLTVDATEGDVIGDVDEQVRFSATGQISTGPGETYSYDLAFVASRIDNNLSVVGVVDVGARGEDVIDALTETSLERLHDAIG